MGVAVAITVFDITHPCSMSIREGVGFGFDEHMQYGRHGQDIFGYQNIALTLRFKRRVLHISVAFVFFEHGEDSLRWIWRGCEK